MKQSNYPYTDEELKSYFDKLDKEKKGEFDLYEIVPVAGPEKDAEEVSKSEIRDHICNSFEGYMEQKIDGEVDSKFELECNLFNDENGNYVLKHSFYEDNSKYSGMEFKTKRTPGSGHKVVFKPTTGVTDLEIASQTMVHSAEALSLENSK